MTSVYFRVYVCTYEFMRNDWQSRCSTVVVGADLLCAPLIEDLWSLYNLYTLYFIRGISHDNIC